MKALIYLKRQGLEVYTAGKPKLLLDFGEKPQIQLTDFLKNNGLVNCQFVVVLAEELVFQKALSEKEKFLEELPFPKDKIVSLDCPDKNLVIAYNGELINLLGKVLSVIPITFLGVSTIDENNFKQILDNKNLLKQANVLEIAETKKTVNLKLIFILGLILVILLLGGGLFYFFRPAEKTILAPQPQPQPVLLTVTPTPVIKKELKIKILNASGKTGYANELKTFLNYSNIETGNATASATSSVNFYNIASEDAKMIFQKVKEFGLNPASASSTLSGNYDVEIILGKPL